MPYRGFPLYKTAPWNSNQKRGNPRRHHCRWIDGYIVFLFFNGRDKPVARYAWFFSMWWVLGGLSQNIYIYIYDTPDTTITYYSTWYDVDTSIFDCVQNKTAAHRLRFKWTTAAARDESPFVHVVWLANTPFTLDDWPSAHAVWSVTPVTLTRVAIPFTLFWLANTPPRPSFLIVHPRSRYWVGQ